MGRLAAAMILGSPSGRYAHSRSGGCRKQRAASSTLTVFLGPTIFAACLLMLAGCGHSLPPISHGCLARHLIFVVNGRKLESGTCFSNDPFTPVFSVTAHPGAVITVEQQPHPGLAGNAVSSGNPEVLRRTFRARDYGQERFRAMKAGDANLQVIECVTAYPGESPGSTVAPFAECVVLRIHVVPAG